jgi:RNA-directed DNA polymerase
MTLRRALQWNVGSCCSDGKREAQVEGLHKCESSEAGQSVGVAHSSEEASVMGAERRGCPSQLESAGQPAQAGMTASMQAKLFRIAKREVSEAWRRVKANRGAGGVDGISIEQFEEKLPKNLYKLWNRMSSGSYFPQAVRRVEIPKKDGSKRPLGIPTVIDRVAQEVVRARLESRLEPLFHEDSYGYRPGKSAHDAVEVCRQRSWKYDWVLDVDIQKFFDTIDHELLMRAVRKHCPDKWMVLYIERWLKAPVEYPDGRKEEAKAGTPQGGVISPLLANLYLHYAFDKWMEREHPSIKFERYADDVIIHCCSEAEAKEMYESLRRRLADCGLTMHPEKTKIVYCKDSNRKGSYPQISFRFLGFTLQPRAAQGRNGEVFTNFLPAASQEAQKHFREKLRSKRLTRSTSMHIEEVSEHLNALLRGWFTYFRRFYKSALASMYYHVDRRLIRWASKKYQWRWRRAAQWLARLKKQRPKLFAHWELLSLPGDRLGRAG